MRRREFLEKSLVGAASLLLGPVLQSTAAAARLGVPPGGQLVFIFLRGGVDLLTFLPPFEDSNYRKWRPGIALRPGAPALGLRLTPPFSLHPRAAPLVPLWKDRQLAFALEVGLPDSIRSHSDAESRLESGTPRERLTRDGFLCRATRLLPAGSPIRAIALQATTPSSLIGATEGVLTFSTLENFETLGQPFDRRAFARLYAAQRTGHGITSLGSSPTEDRVREAAAIAFRAIRDLAPLRKGPGLEKCRAGFPPTLFGRRMGEIAWLLKKRADIPLFVTELGGWDTHSLQGAETGAAADLIGEFSASLRALRDAVGTAWSRTVVVAVTEFGRTVGENGARATDHGYGSLAILAGGRIRGGRTYGQWRELKKENLFEGRDLLMTTDYRQVLSECLSDHLGLRGLETVFPGFQPDPGNVMHFFG